MREENSIETINKSAVTDATVNEAEEIVKKVFNKIESYAKPDKTPTEKFTTSDTNTGKPGIASSSINEIENERSKKKKPLRKPIKGEEDDDDDILGDSLDDDDDDDDEDEEILNDDDDDDEKDNEAEEDEDEKVDGSEHEKGEIEDLDDDDGEEDAVISALVYDEKENGKKMGKVKKHHQTSEAYDDDSDYELGLTGLLARSRHSRGSRQSKETRF
ncbi:nucleolin-like [Bombus pascuorum]|uniref:nucleolin-like n=1 Tax=Bombus pascuorum TaxID=65598 RepID=UPI00298DB735|nr:nucleolin-like [Bombus pascuorum]